MSIQYTVLSALMLKTPFYAELKPDENFFNQEKYINLRKISCEYLEWLIQLLSYYNILSEPNYLKLYNFYWRESHDQVFYSTAIDSTTQKISPYYYPQLYRKKQLMRCSFLLINEAYLCHMMRLELFLQINPTAYSNNKNYLQSTFILGFHASF